MIESPQFMQQLLYKIITDPSLFSKRIKFSQRALNQFSFFQNKDKQRRCMYRLIEDSIKQCLDLFTIKMSQQQSRALATLLGLAVSDALGAFTQFLPFNKHKSKTINTFSDLQKLEKSGKLKRDRLPVGIWTDDTSMALCLADNILINKFQLNPINLRMLFIMWWDHGLNNGGRKQSIGLGKNINQSFDQFNKDTTRPFVKVKDQNVNGNGSIMRLAPVVIPFFGEQKIALINASMQSLTTHNGLQARQCCKLLALILCRLIKRKDRQWREVLVQTCDEFKTDVISVRRLAKSEQQSEQQYLKMISKDPSLKAFNKSVQDRNWNWKDQRFNYSSNRIQKDPHYVGSYCMDALVMALHTVWHTSSFRQLIIWNANMGGDCDSVGAVASQIGGAIYGMDIELLRLYSQMKDFKSMRVQVVLKGYLLLQRVRSRDITFKQQKKGIESSQNSKIEMRKNEGTEGRLNAEIKKEDLLFATQRLRLGHQYLKLKTEFKFVKSSYFNIVNYSQLSFKQRGQVNSAYSILACYQYNSSYHPLNKAIDFGDITAIKGYLQAGKQFKSMKSIFYLCVRAGFKESVEYVHKLGERPKQGEFVVHCAAYFNNLQVLKYLRDLQFDFEERNEQGHTVMEESQNPRIKEYLNSLRSLQNNLQSQVSFVQKQLKLFNQKFQTSSSRSGQIKVILFHFKSSKPHHPSIGFIRGNKNASLAACFVQQNQKPIYSKLNSLLGSHKYYEKEILVRSSDMNTPDRIFIFSIPQNSSKQEVNQLMRFLETN